MIIKLIVSFWISFLVAFAIIVALAHATPTPTKFGVDWAHSFNKSATRNNDPFRIVEIGCRYAKVKNVKVKFYTCSATILDKRSGKEACAVMLISPEGNIMGGQKIKCFRQGDPL